MTRLARPRMAVVPRVRRRRDERGAGGVEFLIVMTTVLAVFVMLTQYGIRLHANRLAEVAAREGAIAAAGFDGTPETGRITARQFLADSPAIRGSSVTVARTASEAQVTVTVQITALSPLLSDPITVTATVPRERFVQ